MNKKTKIIKKGLGIITAVMVGAGGVTMVQNTAVPEEVIDEIVEIAECEASQISLDLKHEKWKVGVIVGTRVSERACITPEMYAQIKKTLRDDFHTKKVDKDGNEYDINPNNKDIFVAALNKEIKEQGGVEISGITTREELKNELINLLN